MQLCLEYQLLNCFCSVVLSARIESVSVQNLAAMTTLCLLFLTVRLTLWVWYTANDRENTITSNYFCLSQFKPGIHFNYWILSQILFVTYLPFEDLVNQTVKMFCIFSNLNRLQLTVDFLSPVKVSDMTVFLRTADGLV